MTTTKKKTSRRTTAAPASSASPASPAVMAQPDELTGTAGSSPAVFRQLTQVSITDIDESLTNPRKAFDEVQLEELARSISVHGVLQPIVLRPSSSSAGRYELIAGARRTRAARRAGLVSIPATVLQANDREVLEIQVVENLQRRDLTPLEEGDGYRLLHGQHQIPVEELARRVGRSVGYVYARMKLAEQPSKIREAVDAGALDPSVAVLLARIPDEKLRLRSLSDILRDSSYDLREGRGPMSYREARDFLQRNVMLRLDRAPFDVADAELVPAAGACTTCPKRTDCATSLWAELDGEPLCQDVACWRQKEEASRALRIRQARAAGVEVVKGPEAEKLRHKIQTATDSILVHGRYQSWQQLLGKKALAEVERVLLAPKSGALREGFRVEALRRKAKEAGVDLRQTSPTAKPAAAPLPNKVLASTVITAAREQLLDAACRAVEGATIGLEKDWETLVLERVAIEACYNPDHLAAVLIRRRIEARELGTGKAGGKRSSARRGTADELERFRAELATLGTQVLVRLLAIGDTLDLHPGGLVRDGKIELPPEITAACKSLRIDIDDLLATTRKRLEAELAEKRAARKAGQKRKATAEKAEASTPPATGKGKGKGRGAAAE